MDVTLEILKNPFTWGLLLGLLLTAFVLKSGLSARRQAKTEIKRLATELRELQGHLNTQLKINSTGNAAMQDELESLRKQNENLRVNNSALQQKPGRAEQRQLQVYEVAIRHMREQAPGFAQAWEKAVREAESEIEASESGFKKLVRRVMPNIGIASASSPSESDEDEKPKES